MKTWEASCDCGWTIRVPYRGTADHRLRHHVCVNYLRRISVDKTPKPCHHKNTQHEHGTHACYVLDACRCVPCSTANRVYENHRNKQHAYGRWNGLTDAQPARDHVQALLAQGLGLKRIAKLTGIGGGTLSKLIYGNYATGGGPSKRIRPATAQRLLAVTPDLEHLGARVPVDPVGTRRRLQALVALGWSQSKLAARLGWSPGNFGKLIHGRQGVGAHTALSVRQVYEQLSMTRPPEHTHRDKIAASRARNYANTRRWLPPLMWDDDQLDNPYAAPPATEETPASRKAARAEDYQWLRANGETDKQIAQRLGISVATLQRWTERTMPEQEVAA